MQVLGYRRCVFVPANPSKGRVVRQGVYYIQGTPIHETDFSFDPEFPACSSVLSERFPDAEAHGIIMPDAESQDDIRRIVSRYNDGQTLFAGAADLFKALLPVSLVPPVLPPAEFGSSTLILCGSTQSRPLDLDIPVSPMPREPLPRVPMIATCSLVGEVTSGISSSGTWSTVLILVRMGSVSRHES